ncbi:MAG: MerC domain-containing protein [Rhizobiaceae bacterium]|nr:MerC domain-containing protein [Rhizobiaceae bacterium]MCV0407250.1 MerC domain-containing protein [Rhizobiaceae bacterium]
MKQLVDATRTPNWLGLAASSLAVVACYGTLAAVAGLSLVGVTLRLPDGAWTVVIVLLALLASSGTALGWSRHGRLAPVLMSLIGLVLIVWVMLFAYSLLIELAGFALLMIAAVWDWTLRNLCQMEETDNG